MLRWRERFLARRTPYYGWAIAAVAASAAFVSGPGQSYVFSIFVNPILLDTGLSRTTLSALYAVGTFVSAGMVFLVSRLVDRWGPRLMLVGIALAFGLACFGMSFATGAASLFVGFAALRALGQGSLPITATLLTAQWFVRYRGRAMALVSLGFAASNAIFPPLVRYLIATFDWRDAYRILGMMVWLLLIPSALGIVRNQPEDIGLYPDGAPTPPAHEPSPTNQHLGSARRNVLRSRTFWLLALPLTANPFITTALVFHQVDIFAARGLDATVAASVFPMFALASAAMTAVAGFVIERIAPKWIVLGTQVLLLLALFQLQFIASPITAVLYAMTLGTASGTQSVASSVAWAEYYGRKGLGAVQGPATMIMISGAALAPLPLAALKQTFGDYTLGLMLSALIPILSMILLSLLRPAARPAG